jgi:hypothetical protein
MRAALVEPAQGHALGGLVGVVFGDEASELLPQEGRNGTAAACGEHPGFLDEVFVQG